MECFYPVLERSRSIEGAKESVGIGMEETRDRTGLFDKADIKRVRLI